MSKPTPELNTAVFYTRDIDAVVGFYVNFIGLEVESRQGNRFVSFKLVNASLGIKKASADREIPGAQTVILSVDNIDQRFHELTRMKATFYKQLVQESWGHTFSILDPDKNKVEFVAMRSKKETRKAG